MLKYYGRDKKNFPNGEPLFRIPLSHIRQACWVDIKDNIKEAAGKQLGTEDLINRIA